LEYVQDIVFSDVRISQIASNSSAQHALGQWFSSPRAAKLQNVCWWWHHSLSRRVIGRFFLLKYSCKSTPGPR